MEKHVRELWDYLKDYGASNIHIEGGSKHQKLLFEYGGLERSLIVAHKPSTDHHAMENTKQALKRMLGPPIPLEEKQPRKLEEMMAEINTTVAPFTYVGTPPVADPPKSKTWNVWVCGYEHRGVSTQVYFHFEDSRVEELFPYGLKIERLDDEHWKLIRSTTRQRSRFGKKKGSRSTVSCLDKLTKPFGSTLTEAIEADGAILVYLPVNKRAPVAPLGVTQPTTKAVAAPAPAALTAKLPVRASIPVTLEEELRDIIRRIQAVEGTCPYHLVRLESGRLQWRAPIIE
jgi:hypothetical protein